MMPVTLTILMIMSIWLLIGREHPAAPVAPPEIVTIAFRGLTQVSPWSASVVAGTVIDVCAEVDACEIPTDTGRTLKMNGQCIESKKTCFANLDWGPLFCKYNPISHAYTPPDHPIPAGLLNHISVLMTFTANSSSLVRHLVISSPGTRFIVPVDGSLSLDSGDLVPDGGYFGKDPQTATDKEKKDERTTMEQSCAAAPHGWGPGDGPQVSAQASAKPFARDSILKVRITRPSD